MLCRFSNTAEITVGEETIISNTSCSSDKIVILLPLSETTVFIIHSIKKGVYYNIYARICTINELQIIGEIEENNNKTIEIINDFSTDSSRGSSISAVQINNNQILIIYNNYVSRGNNNYVYSSYLCEVICTFSKNNISASSINTIEELYQNNDTSVSSHFRLSTSLEKINSNEIALFLSESKGNANMYIKTRNINLIDKTDNCDILGIAKSKGTAGQTVKVIVPN